MDGLALLGQLKTTLGENIVLKSSVVPQRFPQGYGIDLTRLVYICIKTRLYVTTIIANNFHGSIR